MEGDDLLESYFSYAIVIRSPVYEIERLRDYIKTMKETKIICDSISTRNHYITTTKPKDVVNKDSLDEG